MNERIRELTEQAGFVLWDGAVDWASNYDDELEKFAELIVRECANVALREDHEPDECILRHFGVKR
jgi:hypothetical protein